MCYAEGMPRFDPFAGLRYDAASAPLAEVIAPPYDVVDERGRAVLAERSPYNSIQVELPVPDEARGLDRYANAAALLASWEQAGVLRRDDVASFYVYRMRYLDEEGTERSTTGVIGALGIDEPGGGEVLPHERTMPKPKGDRLDLLRACRTNCSPIWGLSLTNGLTAACTTAVAGLGAPIGAEDEDGINHEYWPVSDPEAIAEIANLVAASPVVIADGHHRYETAGFYRAERRGANADQPGPYDTLMAYIVELSPDELQVQAIHRLISGLSGDVALLAALAESFVIEPGPSDPLAMAKEMAARGALGLLTSDQAALLVPTPELSAAAEADLDSSRLDAALAGLPPHEVAYQHGLRNVADAVESGQAQAGFLLRPATVAQIADTAHLGRRTPPKTTFFQPKPRTGIVFRSLAE